MDRNEFLNKANIIRELLKQFGPIKETRSSTDVIWTIKYNGEGEEVRCALSVKGEKTRTLMPFTTRYHDVYSFTVYGNSNRMFKLESFDKSELGKIESCIKEVVENTKPYITEEEKKYMYQIKGIFELYDFFLLNERNEDDEYVILREHCFINKKYGKVLCKYYRKRSQADMFFSSKDLSLDGVKLQDDSIAFIKETLKTYLASYNEKFEKKLKLTIEEKENIETLIDYIGRFTTKIKKGDAYTNTKHIMRERNSGEYFELWFDKESDGELCLYVNKPGKGSNLIPITKGTIAYANNMVGDYFAGLYNKESYNVKPQKTDSIVVEEKSEDVGKMPYSEKQLEVFELKEDEQLEFFNENEVEDDNENSIDSQVDVDEEFAEDIIIEEVDTKRSVYIFNDFNLQLDTEIKNKEVCDKVREYIIYHALVKNNDELENWINNKHNFPYKCSNGKIIYRIRSPKVKSSDMLDLNRVLLCKGSQINKKGIGPNDIVLLSYLGRDKHDSYKEEANSIASLIDEFTEEVKEFEGSVSKRVKRGDGSQIIYKVVLQKGEDGGKLRYIPVLDATQQSLLDDTLLINPPCLVYGSAGTGKTLLSEELYENLSYEYDNVLYITYMNRLKNEVVDELQARGIENPNAVDLDELFCTNIVALKENPKLLKSGDDFRKWAKDSRPYRKTLDRNFRTISKNEDEALNTAYIFFRTFSFTESMNSLQNFLSDTAKEHDLSEDQKKAIYGVCSEYQKHIDEKGFYTDNKAAGELKELNLRKYDAIIVDEIQDLTRVQVDALYSLLKHSEDGKNPKYFAFGDDNQAINPTLLRLSEADQVILSNYEGTQIGRTKKDKVINLTDSYRSTDYLIRYINYINSIRSDVIGKDKVYNEAAQKSKLPKAKDNESDKPIYVTDRFVIEQGLSDKELVTLNNVMIITPNENELHDLGETYPHLLEGGSTNVLTVEETKGGEWENVILYNFFSSAQEVWKRFAEVHENKDAKALRSTINRMYFNRFYVGLTRAAKKVIIMETEPLDQNIVKYFLPELLENNGIFESVFVNVTDYDNFKSFFSNDYDHTTWYERAKEKFRIRDYVDAYDFINKAIRALATESFDGKEEKEHYYNRIRDQYELMKSFANREFSVEEVNRVTFDDYYNDTDFIKHMYNATKQEIKYALINANTITDASQFIESYKKAKDAINLLEKERELFNVKAIEAYKYILREKMRGMNDGK